MFSSLRSRLSLTYFLVIAIVLGMAAFVLVVVVRNVPVRNMNVRLQELTRLVAPAISFDGQVPQRQAEALHQAAVQYEIRVLIVGRAGAVLFDSGAGVMPNLNRFPPNALERAADGGPTGTIRDENGQVWLFSARKMENASLVLAAPRPGFNWLNIFADDLLPPLLWASGIAVLLSILIAGATARWVARPLDQMAEAASQVPEGEYSTIIEDGPQEVRELARAFNKMTAQVRAGQQSQRDFVANVSHELKTPLTAIQGFAQAISDGTAASPEAIDRAAGVIHTEAGRMHNLVVDLLELARLEGGGFKVRQDNVPLGDLLNGIIKRFDPITLERGIMIERTGYPDQMVRGDADRLVQVFTNLLDNAVRVSAPGGSVSVHLSREGAYAVISISDAGPGIPKAEQERIFERFYQLDKSRAHSGRGGFGLGLAIAREIVQAHGGELSVESVEGQGSTFVVRIPVG
jgi:signal transduction histidine kinase